MNHFKKLFKSISVRFHKLLLENYILAAEKKDNFPEKKNSFPENFKGVNPIQLIWTAYEGF